MATEVKLPKSKTGTDAAAEHQTQLDAHRAQMDRNQRQTQENGTPGPTPTTPKRLVP